MTKSRRFQALVVLLVVVLAGAVVVCCFKIWEQTQQIYLLNQHLNTLQWLDEWFEQQLIGLKTVFESGIVA